VLTAITEIVRLVDKIIQMIPSAFEEVGHGGLGLPLASRI
jgi:hypothetical protein